MELSEAQAMCQYIPEIAFVMETSAKDNTNIKDIFYLLATKLKVNIYIKEIVHVGNIALEINSIFPISICRSVVRAAKAS